jgi:hypothetical protein
VFSGARSGIRIWAPNSWPVSSHPQSATEDVPSGTSGLEAMAAVEAALAGGDDTAPVLLTDAAPWLATTTSACWPAGRTWPPPRRRAVWLLVPQLGGNHGPLLDGRPVPLASPNQFVPLDNDWIDGIATAGAMPVAGR